MARAGDIPADGLSLKSELEVKYPRPPKTLDGDPMQASIVLLEFEFKGIVAMNGLDGAALVKAGDDGYVVRAATMKGHLVMFQLSDPGDYSLRFIRLSNYNAYIVAQPPPDIEITVTVAKGTVSYLGTVVVKKLFGTKPSEMELVYDAEREAAAWSTFKGKYAKSPWSPLAEQRIASLKSGGTP